MASPTWWTWVWVNSRSWWRTGKPGMQQSMGLQRVGHNWVTELTEGRHPNPLQMFKEWSYRARIRLLFFFGHKWYPRSVGRNNVVVNFIQYKENYCNREVKNRVLLRERKFFSSTENNLAKMLQRGFNSSMDNCQIWLIYGIVMGYILNNGFLISTLTYSIRVSRGGEACIFSKSVLADSKDHPSLTSSRSF